MMDPTPEPHAGDLAWLARDSDRDSEKETRR